MMTSETSSGFTLALFRTSLMTNVPRSWRGTLLRAPLNDPVNKIGKTYLLFFVLTEHLILINRISFYIYIYIHI